MINVEFLGAGAETAWIKPQGRLNRSRCFELATRLHQLLRQGCQQWVLDLSQVQGLGPEALGLLAHWGDEGKLALAGVQEGHARLLEAAKLGQRFPQYQNRDDYLSRGKG